MMCGGTTDVKPVDDDVRVVFEEIKAELQAQTETTGEFEIHGYKTQVVAGTNYFIKCSAAGKFVHARVFKPLPHTNEPASLHSVQHGESINETSSLEYF
ncbi:unnamed protein product [Oikopleura dioica]|uniref:Cystatin domain-containing protein n=1 Tax=Oikopleura dioica TaxID=34765 RepID=E4YF11_OIKDI|nr:unnamed protein product [Oikopleura dioica]